MLEAIADSRHPRGADDLPVRKGNEAQRDVQQESERDFERQEPRGVPGGRKKTNGHTYKYTYMNEQKHLAQKDGWL